MEFSETKIKLDSIHRGKKAKISCVVLSDYIKGKVVDLLKMDIEGAEGEVFDELASKKMIENIQNIIMEYHHFSSRTNRLSGILRHFEDGGLKSTFSAGVEFVPDIEQRNFSHIMVFAKRD